MFELWALYVRWVLVYYQVDGVHMRRVDLELVKFKFIPPAQLYIYFYYLVLV